MAKTRRVAQQQQQAMFQGLPTDVNSGPYIQSNPVLGRLQKDSEPSVKNFVTLENSFKEIDDNITLKMKFQCNRPMVISLLIDGYEDQDPWLRSETNPLLANDPNIIFKHSFHCGYSIDVKRKVFRVKLPSRLTCSPGILMPRASTIEDVQLKVFMTDMEEWRYIKMRSDILRHKMQVLYERSKLKFHLPVSAISPYDRNKCDFGKCLTWSSKIAEYVIAKNPLKSAPEEECSFLVNFPIVLGEEPYGVIKTYSPFYNRELKRRHKPPVIRISLSLQMYMSSWCKSNKLCGLFQHVDPRDDFETPIILINNRGQLHIQSKLSGGQASAHTTEWSVPLREWVRLDISQMNSLVNVTLMHGRNLSEIKHVSIAFQNSISFSDSSGYFVVGGTVYCKNFDGVIRSAYFCRNKKLSTETVPSPDLRPPILDYNLTRYEKRLKILQKVVKRKMNFYKKMQQKDVCVPYFVKIIHSGSEQIEDLQCPADSAPLPKRFDDLNKVLQKIPATVNSGDALEKAGDELYDVFLERLERPNSLQNLTNEINLLQQSAKLGHGLSHFMLYVIYKNGIGTQQNLKLARFNLMLGAKQGERLCLKTLGYNHLHGIDGFPRDPSISFYYYFNAAHKTQKDLLAHSESMTTVNNARLTDEKKMKEQLSEEDDLFHWIKHQATKGVFSAQRNMARLLYWGQQGLQRDLGAAFKLYEEAAQGGDATALYDYGIVLIKGHGTDVNTQKGAEVLKKAAEMKHPGALNTLGWYYSTQEINMTKAKDYFEQSDELGSVDAAYNLGLMYHTGKYPGSEKNYGVGIAHASPSSAVVDMGQCSSLPLPVLIKSKVVKEALQRMAFKKYYRAATGGHVEACIQVSYFMATGIHQFLIPNTRSAIFWSQFISDKSPMMGNVIREGLQAYRRQSWSKALLMYLAAAETGFEVAQFNAAFLCEENQNNLVKGNVQSECAWKYWNSSSLTHDPHPHALNKMGDYYYYGHGGNTDVEKALDYYERAAQRNFPQAIFNIACMLESYENITNANITRLNIPRDILQSKEDTIIHLYRRCSEVSGESTSIPCYMALMRTKTIHTWRTTPLAVKVSTFIIMVVSTLVLFSFQTMRNRRLRGEVHSSHARSSTDYFPDQQSNSEAGNDVENGTSQCVNETVSAVREEEEVSVKVDEPRDK